MFACECTRSARTRPSPSSASAARLTMSRPWVAARNLLHPLRRPLDRPLQMPRAPGGEHVLGVERGLHAEAAADVADQDADLLGRDAQDILGELVAQARRRLATDPQRDASGRRVETRQRGARLDRTGRQALVDEFEFDHVRRLRKGGVALHGIAVARLAGEVAGRGRPDQRSPVGKRIGDGRDRGQRGVADVDRLGGVARLLAGFGHHRSHGLADVAHDVDRQCMLRRRLGPAAAGALEVPRLRQRLDPGGHQFRAGDDGQHAGQRARRGCVERLDARVRMRRAQENQVRLSGQREVLGELAAAGQQAVVFDAADGLAAAEAGDVGGVSHGRIFAR